jgi:hypothetical protein
VSLSTLEKILAFKAMSMNSHLSPMVGLTVNQTQKTHAMHVDITLLESIAPGPVIFPDSEDIREEFTACLMRTTGHSHKEKCHELYPSVQEIKDNELDNAKDWPTTIMLKLKEQEYWPNFVRLNNTTINNNSGKIITI